jgi:glycosyltransferase involved in cell wall biosynthesis
MRNAVSVVILTKNEETLIARAMQSVSWADEIVIVDSGSCDRTCDIARQMGAVVHFQPWLGWTSQHKRGVELATHSWIMTIDADEIVTDELGRSIVKAMSGLPNPNDGYVVERRDDFLGSLIFNTRRRSKKAAFVRLFNREFSRYDERLSIHEEVRSPGKLIKLDGQLLHCRNSTIAEITHTHNRNTDIEAGDILRGRRKVGFFSVLIRPPLRFLWVYIWCGNWRLGTRGLILAYMYANAEFLRYAKVWEMASHELYPSTTGLSDRPASKAVEGRHGTMLVDAVENP